jgi:hypothetical protein
VRVERERRREATDQVDEQTGGNAEYWVVFVTITSDEHATLFKLA